MTVSADTLCRSGIPYPTAIELARQINAGPSATPVADTNKLVASGIVPSAAKELVAQISAGAVTSAKLVAAGLPHEVSIQIKKTSGLWPFQSQQCRLAALCGR
jgi:hypothetical protein